MRKQTYTSANTSLKQVPAIYKRISIQENDIILDYGCGKYNLAKDYVESKKATYYGYDPYNRTEEENKLALSIKPTKIICANVLNVIEESHILYNIIKQVASYHVPTYFSIYEGDRTGVGKPTKNNCYQRNEKAIQYTRRLENHFPFVTRKGNIFICTNKRQ